MTAKQILAMIAFVVNDFNAMKETEIYNRRKTIFKQDLTLKVSIP